MARALILSGGGSKGSFQTGAIKFLAEQEITWDIISGVSVGALNAAFISQYSRSKQLDGALALFNLWNSLKGNGDIYKPHSLGIVGRLIEGGYYSIKPLKELIENNISMEKLLSSEVKFYTGAISCTTGEFRCVSKEHANIHDWIMASSAFPVAFPPVHIDEDTWTDGGLGKYSSLEEILLLHPEIDIIDFISTDSTTSITHTPENIKINIYCPEKPLTTKALNFSPQKIKVNMQLGYEDTKREFEKNKTSI